MKKFVLLIVATVLVAAGWPVARSAKAQVPIPLTATTVGPVDEATRSRYVQALEIILRYYQQEFGQMPVPSVQLYLYGSTDLFEKGLIEVGGVTSDQARVIARANSALAAARTWSILVNATLRRRLGPNLEAAFQDAFQVKLGDFETDFRSYLQSLR